MQQAVTADLGPSRQARHPGDTIFALVARCSGLFVLLLLGGIIVVLFLGGLQRVQDVRAGLPGFRRLGPGAGYLWRGGADLRHCRHRSAGAALAVPLAFGIAFYLTELAPRWLRRPVSTAIELLAAVPSIIYGMWGFFVIVPIMAQYIQPTLIDNLGDLPGIGFLFTGPPFGTGILTASLILAVMIIPFIAATMRDVFETVPPVFKESAYGLGCTTWEVMRSIVIPYTRISVVGGIMLGLGRALGETMAVTFVIGNTNRITSSLFGPGNTIASLVALEFPESQSGSLKLSSLLALGFILFVISFIVLAISRLLLRPRMKT